MVSRRRRIVFGAVLAGAVIATGSTAIVFAQQGSNEPDPMFETVLDKSFESHGVKLLLIDPDSVGVELPPPDDISAALAEWGFPGELAEEPKLARFVEPIPGIDRTATDDFWVLVLSKAVDIGGAPYSGSVGTYWVAFLSAQSGRVEYAIAGESVP